MTVAAVGDPTPLLPAARRHAREADYRAWVQANLSTYWAQWSRMDAYRWFVRRWPDLEQWFAAALPDRLAFAEEDAPGDVTRTADRLASSYLVYLSLVEGMSLDFDYLLGRKYGRLLHPAAGGGGLGVDLGLLDRHAARLIELGYSPSNALPHLTWGLGRLMLYRGDPDLTAVTAADLFAFGEAVRRFAERPDFLHLRRALYRNRERQFTDVAAHAFVRTHLAKLHTVHVLLFNIGQVSEPPLVGTRRRPTWADRLLPEPCPEAIREVVERYLRLRLQARLDRPQTVRLSREALRRFIGWLRAEHPEIDNLAGVDRLLIEGYLCWLPTCHGKDTGQPLAVTTVNHEIKALAAFFRDTAAWGWADVPGRPLLVPRDGPRLPQPVPRYLPRHELDALMTAIDALPNADQRAALLLVRWSGARRDEIRRLALDCLDAYPGGHPRLRIPVGKSHAERLIPLHPQAARALQDVIDQTRQANAAARYDHTVGRRVQHVFVRRGKLLSASYLFDAALRTACTAAGLVDDRGVPTVSAHRFRHTVGTELAEGGARLQTIMAVLGHRSAGMSLIYSRISDPEVRRQYEQALEAGARIAGPAADALLHEALDPAAVHWLQTNFLKTELELGHCLRLPAEGPCECDLVLTCPKFLTTSEYAPRLRGRLTREDELIADAKRRGWPREVERHQRTRQRIQQLLTDLGEDPGNDPQAGRGEHENGPRAHPRHPISLHR